MRTWFYYGLLKKGTKRTGVPRLSSVVPLKFLHIEFHDFPMEITVGDTLDPGVINHHILYDTLTESQKTSHCYHCFSGDVTYQLHSRFPSKTCFESPVSVDPQVPRSEVRQQFLPIGRLV